ncbi:MAG: Crp/Fnr family transcriptional regulator [Treponema sp.]|nr:MAG: Crp/Fnr family transcriptional regulator [Treponema sp.]
MSKDNIDNLTKFKIFDNISESSKEKIKQNVIIKKVFNANERVARKGDKLNHALLINKGCLRTLEYMIDGKEMVSSYYIESDAFPFYLHFGKTNHLPYDVYALKKSEVLFLPFDIVENLIQDDPVFMKNLLEFISEYTCFYRLLLRATQYNKVVQRIAYWLLHIDEIDSLKFPSSQNMLANILRVNRPSLNQELKRLSQLKIIKMNKMKFEILNREYLENLIE